LGFGESSNGFSQVKVKNETEATLGCFITIDGHKAKFRLRMRSTSRWITTTDARFTYRDFSTWCDYLEVYPNYKAYQAY
jgi:hypothetical protein